MVIRYRRKIVKLDLYVTGLYVFPASIFFIPLLIFCYAPPQKKIYFAIDFSLSLIV